jgi:hypothetical protein
MIVSHEHKFIFLKSKKTAGTSIELALSQLCGPSDILTPLTRIDEASRAGGRGGAELAPAWLMGQPATAAEAPLAQLYRSGLWFLQSYAG